MLKVVLMTTEEIKKKILNSFKNVALEVIDQTGMGNNFMVVFNNYKLNKSKLETHREIMKIFADELKSGAIHALSIKI